MDQNVRFFETNPIILGAPQSSFYPTYLDQNNKTKKNGAKYLTYDVDKARLAGRKRYLLKPESLNQSEIPIKKDGTPNYKVASILQTIDSGHVFEGKVRFHNLNEDELGALVLAMKIHEMYPNEFFHNLGMAKPLGFGRVSFEEVNVVSDKNEIIESSELKFLEFADKKIGSLPTLEILRSMQHLKAISGYETNYPKFSTDRNSNDFATYLKKDEPSYSLIDVAELISNVNISFENRKKQAKKQEKESVKESFLEQASEETQDFVEIQTYLSHAEKDLTGSLIKNIAKELNLLHAKYTQEGLTITKVQLEIIQEIVQKSTDLNKPKINAAIKKILRDISDV